MRNPQTERRLSKNQGEALGSDQCNSKPAAPNSDPSYLARVSYMSATSAQEKNARYYRQNIKKQRGLSYRNLVAVHFVSLAIASSLACEKPFLNSSFVLKSPTNSCGDGVVDTGEECDDANQNSNDECVDCRRARCGDGFVGPLEECDEGELDTLTCDFATGRSIHACTWSRVGDGYANPNFETCEDGNLNFDDECHPLGTQVASPAALNRNTLGDVGDDSAPQIVTDARGNWVVAWLSTDAVNSNILSDVDILVARSTDQGRSWTWPIPINANSDITFFPPHIATGNGTWLAVWSSDSDPDGMVDFDHDIMVARSFDGGQSWTWPTVLNTNASSDTAFDYSPYVATNDSGVWLAVWASRSEKTSSDDVLIAKSTNDGESWTPPAPLHIAAAGSGDDRPQQVVTNGWGTWMVVWQNWNPPESQIRVVRSPDGGATWTLLDFLPAETRSVSITTDRAGNWLAVCLSYYSPTEDVELLIMRSSDDGKTWTPPVLLNPESNLDHYFDQDPQIVTDGRGTWITSWKSSDFHREPDKRTILFTYSMDDGVLWSTPEVITTSAAASHFIFSENLNRIATDIEGNWLSVWESHDNLDGSIGYDRDILFSHYSNEEATWVAPAPLNVNATDDLRYDDTPDIATDGDGNWVAIWASATLGTHGPGRSTSLVVAQSSNRGSMWTNPSPLGTNADYGPSNRNPDLVSGSWGTWVTVWEAGDNLGSYNILASRSENEGMTWTSPVPLNAPSAPPHDYARNSSPALSTDGYGTWLAVWTSSDTVNDTISIDADIFVARTDDDAATWESLGPLNTNASSDSGDDYTPQIATDGMGTWLVVWTSEDSLERTIGSDTDILFARSTNDAMTWSQPAPVNTNAPFDFGDDFDAQVSFGAGVWIVIWSSTNSFGSTIGSDEDIFISRSFDGGFTWSPPASLNTNAGTDLSGDLEPHIATDGLNSWVTVWTSTYGGDYDVFVSRSSDQGESWTSPAPLNTNAARDSGIDTVPKIATNRRGTWMASWVSLDTLGGILGDDPDIIFTTFRLPIAGAAP